MSTAAIREDLLSAFAAALARAQPGPALNRICTRHGNVLELGGTQIDLASFESVWIVGAGKAVAPLAAAAMELIGDRVSGISITTRHGHGGGIPFELWEAGHPVPDVGSLAGAADALRICGHAGPGDLVLCLLTGGASALWTAPPSGIPLDDLRELTGDLLRSGAPIQEINCVRKHLSRISGGHLAAAAAPARVVTLAISDVVGTGPDAIGSGPTLPDPTTYEEALGILSARAIHAPSSVMSHLQRGAAGEVPETPKRGDLPAGDFHIIADVGDALAGAAAELEHRGYQIFTLPFDPCGDAADTGMSIARDAIHRSSAGAHRVALLWGGESTVHVTGDGLGGRNQEMALAAAHELSGAGGVVMGCFATDGSDGNTSAAGAFVDGSTIDRAAALGLDWAEMLGRNDSHTLLKALGDLVVTGPTGTNVNDLAIALLA